MNSDCANTAPSLAIHAWGIASSGQADKQIESKDLVPALQDWALFSELSDTES
jgi:hypothetical protein